MENINIFDLVVIILITLLGLKGLFRGLTKELFGLVGIVGGVFIASRLAKETGAFIDSIIPLDNENSILLAGFVLTLVVFWIVAYLLGTILEKVFYISGLGIFDKLFGFIFGAGKIFLLFSIIAYAVTNVKMINDKLNVSLENSIMMPLFIETGGYIIKLDTIGLQESVSKQLDVVVDATKDTIEELSKEELEKRAIELKKQLEETTSEK
ncbi:MAG: CvpA family protein [Campylobacterota bacterium]|nr:CvpA family protein [Campylobacterota bacterium]